jgi:hypothetical protein
MECGGTHHTRQERSERMSRLIDADKLELDAEWSDYYNAYMAYSSYQINDAEEVKAIPLDKVKKAREEMEDLETKEIFAYDEESYISGIVEYVSLAEVREILDNLISESEDE